MASLCISRIWSRSFLLMSSLSCGLVMCSASHVRADILKVGASQQYKMPSDAAAHAKDGDTIEIDPGEYFDCAVWKANHLTIAGTGPKVVIMDKACNGKGLFVIDGNDETVKNLTLSGARVPDLNGAGIRAEGVNLKVEAVRFINNQNGLMSNPVPGSIIEVDNSEFIHNGNCENPSGCGHGLYIGRIARARITNSKFFESKEGHHIKSRAARTEVIGNDISDGEKGTASYLVEVPEGGDLIMENNTLEKGPMSSNHSAAVVIGIEGVDQRTTNLIIKDNKFVNDNEHETIFVRNMTATPAVLTGNTLKGKVKALTGDGQVQ